MRRQHSPSPAFLVSKLNIYYLRLAVPADLRAIVGRRELRVSLRTGYLGEAREKAALVAPQVKLLFRRLRELGDGMSELTREQIPALVRAFIKKQLDSFEDWQAVRAKWFAEEFQEWVPWSDKPKPVEPPQPSISRLFSTPLAAGRAVSANDPSKLIPFIREFLSSSGVGYESDGTLLYGLAREALKAQPMLTLLLDSRQNGNYAFEKNMFREDAPELYDVLHGLNNGSGDTPAPASAPQAVGGDTLSEAFKRFAEDKKAEDWDREKTANDYKSKLDLLIEVLGDREVATITRADMAGFKEVLRKLPPNRGREPYAGKSIPEILAMNPRETLHPSTIRGVFLRLSAFFTWAVDNELIDKNPVLRMTPRAKSGAVKEAAFDGADLEKLFLSPAFKEDKHHAPYAFWIPVLALFTGARLEELAQLRTDDVRQEKGVWVLGVKEDSTGEQKLKNKSSFRLVPLHPFLSDTLNLPGFAAKLRQEGHERLFPELPPQGEDNKFGPTVSKWFTRYRRRHGVGNQKGRRSAKDFHSFRHTMSRNLRGQFVEERLTNQLQGWAMDGSTGLKEYYDGDELSELLEKAVEKLDFGVDLSHLGQSRYVVKGKPTPAKPKAKRRTRAGKK